MSKCAGEKLKEKDRSALTDQGLLTVVPGRGQKGRDYENCGGANVLVQSRIYVCIHGDGGRDYFGDGIL